ncbi:MAG: carbohydrate kinase family protein [Planctomycetaceae bacterium]
MSILGIGTVVLDHAVLLPDYPACDTKHSLQKHWKQVGGPVPIALSTAAFYGSRCKFFSQWGNDESGQYITAELTNRGLDTSLSQQSDDWESGFAQIWTVPDGRRTIAYSRGQFPTPAVDALSEFDFTGCQLLHLDGWAGNLAVETARRAKQHGCKVVLDAGSVKPGIDELLPLADILIASSLFRQSRFGTTEVNAEQLMGLGSQSVITTHGDQGATWITTKSKHHHPGFSVDAIDTNGAGDVFSGALIHKLTEGAANEEALEFATAVAALSCCHYGNATLPRIAEIEKLRNAQ